MLRPIIAAGVLTALLPALLQTGSLDAKATVAVPTSLPSSAALFLAAQSSFAPPIHAWDMKGTLVRISQSEAAWTITSPYRVPPGDIVDVEIHQNGQKVWQAWSSHGGNSWHGQATQLPPGKWSLDVGIFQPGWASLDGWWNGLASSDSVNPATVSLKAVAAQVYNAWRETYVVPSGSGMLRVIRPQNQNDTVSEGIGYGMLLAAGNHDLSTFQGLWAYAQKYQDANGLMNWEINAAGQVVGTGSATDADEDMAYALVLAHHNWPGLGFGSAAKTLINTILAHDVSASNRILPGDSWGPTPIMNPSYISPAYYQVFAQFTGNSRWAAIARQNSQWLVSQANPETGLLPDWINANGTLPSIPWDQYPNAWYYDAVRVPWRLWMAASSGNQAAKQVLTAEGKWILHQDSVSLTSGYTLTGQPLNSYESGPFLSAAVFMAQYADPALAQKALNQLEAWHSTTYYGASLRALALTTLAQNLVPR